MAIVAGIIAAGVLASDVKVSVQSSDLDAVGYNPMSGTLEVDFKAGRSYRYFGVPIGIYLGLIGATSVGGFFHANIKNIYPFIRVA